jgi:hypothetical protein
LYFDKKQGIPIDSPKFIVTFEFDDIELAGENELNLSADFIVII